MAARRAGNVCTKPTTTTDPVDLFNLNLKHSYSEPRGAVPPDSCPPFTNTPRSDARPATPPSSSSSSSATTPSLVPLADYTPRGAKSLSGIALRAFLLGFSLCFSLTLILAIFSFGSSSSPPSPLWRLPFFLAALSLFHFLEFYTTAAYNTPAANVDAFLLTSNWPAYAIAHSFAAFESLVTCTWLAPTPYAPLGLHPCLLVVGLVLVVVGQAVRSLAMVTAGRSFNHTVQHRKADSHALVTSGIYAWLRHPSYFGFFWWAVGTQLVMGNLVSFVGYALVLWRFFSRRIEHEEELLIKFFGRDYEVYRAKVGTLIPLCG